MADSVLIVPQSLTSRDQEMIRQATQDLSADAADPHQYVEDATYEEVSSSVKYCPDLCLR